MTRNTRRTAFRSRGRLTGLVRDEDPAGTGQNRTTQTDNRESALRGADEALFYRAASSSATPSPARSAELS